MRGMIIFVESQQQGRGEGTKRAKSGATNGILEQKIEWAANTGVWIGEFGYMPDLNVLIYSHTFIHDYESGKHSQNRELVCSNFGIYSSGSFYGVRRSTFK